MLYLIDGVNVCTRFRESEQFTPNCHFLSVNCMVDAFGTTFGLIIGCSLLC